MMSPVSKIRHDARLWVGVVIVLIGVLLGFGLPFLIGGISVAPYPPAYETITRFVPGNLHLYGGILTLLALGLIHGLAFPAHGHHMSFRWLHGVLIVTAVYTVCVVATFGITWNLTGSPLYQPMIYWGSMAALATLAAGSCPEDHGGSRRGS